MTRLGNVLRVLLVSSLLAVSTMSVIIPSPAHAVEDSVTLLSSGSVMMDPLTTGDISSWTFSGTAVRERAPYAFGEDSQGLHILIQAASANQWAGFFAKSPNTYARIFHAMISLPYSSIPSGNFNTGLYVQTTNSVTYVACVGHVTPKGYYWLVSYAQGSQSTVVKSHRLYTQMGGPRERDCTIMTDGQTFLVVYLDGKKVYSNQSMGLQMPPPFNAFLEVESTCASKMLSGSYSNFYEMAGNRVTIRGVPPGDMASIPSPMSGPLSGVAGPDGVVSLDVSALHMPIAGNVQVTGADDGVAVSTGTIQIWGGDLYQVGLSRIR